MEEICLDLTKRRKSFSKEMKNNSLVLFFSKDQIIKCDGEYFDFCDTNLFYLTQIEQANTKLILHKDNNGKFNEYLFIEEQTDFSKLWEGEKITKFKAKQLSQIENVFYLENFEEVFLKLKKQIQSIYFFESSKMIFKSQDLDKIKQKIKEENEIEILNSFEIIRDLRQIKSEFEIEQIKRAISITKIGFDEVFKNLNNYKNECEIEAILTYNFTKNFTKHSYHPIVASGINSCTMHYIKNNQYFENRNLVLIDSGSEFNNYKSDITRTYPLSGKFSKREKEVYTKVLEIQKFAISLLKQGVKRMGYELKILDFVNIKLQELNLVENKTTKENMELIRRYYPHSTSHFLGLDTHDIGNYEKEFQKNQVLTVEPGIYIVEEEIGIRIEDNILIKENSCEILSYEISKEVKEIEF